MITGCNKFSFTQIICECLRQLFTLRVHLLDLAIAIVFRSGSPSLTAMNILIIFTWRASWVCFLVVLIYYNSVTLLARYLLANGYWVYWVFCIRILLVWSWLLFTKLCQHHLLSHIFCTLDWVKHLVKFTCMGIFRIVLLLKILHHFIYTWLLKILFPELKNSFISLLCSVFPEILSGHVWIMAFERVPQEGQPLEHHNVSWLITLISHWFAAN